MADLSRTFWLYAVCAISVVDAAAAQSLDERRAFDIPAQNAADALILFSKQSEVQVITASADLRTRKSPAVVGTYASRIALARLLAGSGLQWREAGQGSVVVAASAVGNGVIPAASAAPASVPQPASVPVAAVDNGSESLLEEILVTARKRTESQRDVPISIVTVSGDELAAAKITQLVDLTSRVPSLTLSFGANSPFAQIRGLGTGNNPSFDQAVGKFVDNVSYGRDQDLRLPLFDIERVEVLKGPQVLLYGNSTTAGALNITTRKPGDELAADASLAYEFEGREVVGQGGLTLPLGPALSLRVAGLYQNLDRGHVYNVLTDEHVPTVENHAERAILRFRPGGDFEALLKAEYARLRTDGAPSEIVVPPAFRPTPFPEFTLDGVTAVDNDVAPFFQPAFNELENATYQLDMNYDAFGGRLTSTTGYRDSRYAGSAPAYHPFPLANALISNSYDQFSQELRFNGTAGPADLTLGLFYQHEDLAATQAIDFSLAAIGFPVPPFAANFLLDQKTRSYSAFGDIIYRLTEALSIELGARVTRVTRDADQSASTGNVVPDKRLGGRGGLVARNPALDPAFGILFGTVPHFFTGLEFKETFVQPQAVLQYRFADRNQVYVKYVKGDKAGGFDSNYPGTPAGNFPSDARFESETAESFEIGAKGLTLDNRLTYAVSAFSTTFKDLQTNAFVAEATVSLVTNVGKSRSRGFEVELGYAPLPGLRLGVTGTYADAEYLDFPGAACTLGQLAATPVACLQDLSGKPTIFSSKWSGTFSIDYTQPVGGYELSAGAVVVARSKYNPSTNSEPYHEQKGYAQVDAHIDLAPADGPWSLSLFGRNLTGVNHLEFGETVPVSQGALAAYRSRGRQIGVRAGIEF